MITAPPGNHACIHSYVNFSVHMVNAGKEDVRSKRLTHFDHTSCHSKHFRKEILWVEFNVSKVREIQQIGELPSDLLSSGLAKDTSSPLDINVQGDNA